MAITNNQGDSREYHHGVAGAASARFGEDLYDIEPLNEQKIEEFIKKWFCAVSARARGLGEVTAGSMTADISQHEHIPVFTRNPLLLTAVCILYQDGKRIPEQRADLYNRIIVNLKGMVGRITAALYGIDQYR